jgi:hypothetical protein
MGMLHTFFCITEWGCQGGNVKPDELSALSSKLVLGNTHKRRDF